MMAGGGAGGRPGVVPSGASDDRPAIRAARAVLIGLAGNRIAVVTVVVDGRVPECIMFNGDPFLHVPVLPSGITPDDLTYRETRPFRADMVEGA